MTARGTGRPTTGWTAAAYQLVVDRPALAGTGLTPALDLAVSAA